MFNKLNFKFDSKITDSDSKKLEIYLNNLTLDTNKS